MNSLLSIRLNILYSKLPKKKKEYADEYEKFTEIILLCDKPSYEFTNERDVIRKREVEELRFIVSEAALDALIKRLQAIKDADDNNIEQE